MVKFEVDVQMFQHTAARRRLVRIDAEEYRKIAVSTHSRPKAAGNLRRAHQSRTHVSTHSRPKAAGDTLLIHAPMLQGFNTQPPEGGWMLVRFPNTFV